MRVKYEINQNMKRCILIFSLIFLSLSVICAQQVTQGPYTVMVNKTINSPWLPPCSQGALLVSDSQVDANKWYFLRVSSTGSPGAIKIDDVDGFFVGQQGACPFAVSINPTIFAGDVGSFNEWTIRIPIKTFSFPDFAVPLYMRVQRSYDGITWGDTEYITFPRSF